MSGHLSVGVDKRRVFPSRPLASSCDFYSYSSSFDVWMWFLFYGKIKIPSGVVDKRLVWSNDEYKNPVEVAIGELSFLGSPQSANFYGSLVFNPCLP